MRNYKPSRKTRKGFQQNYRTVVSNAEAFFTKTFGENKHLPKIFCVVILFIISMFIFPRNVDKFEVLKTWVSVHGGVVGDLELKINSDGVRGLFAAQTFKKNETILKIPSKVILPANTSVCNHPEKNALVHEAEIGHESFWFPYLEILPSLKDYHAYHPLFLPHEMLNSFQPLTSDFGYQEMEQCCEESDFHCRMALVQRTRAYYNPTKPKQGAVLVPIADLANTCHKGMNTEWAFKEGNFILKATKRIEKGKEIFDAYTAMGNVVIYKTWGFMFKENPMKTRNLTKGTCEYVARGCQKYKNDIRAHPLMTLVQESCPGLCKF